MSSHIYTIGVVDDEPKVLQIFKGLGIGSKIKCSENPSEGINWAENNEVDAIVADLDMPALSGVELLRKCREINKNVKLFLLTGLYPNPFQERICNEIGAQIHFKSEFEILKSEIIKLSKETLKIELHDSDVNRMELISVKKLVDEFVQPLVTSLAKIENQDTKMHNTNLTVRELIYEINSLSPIGMEYIRLWEQTKETLTKFGKS